MSCSLELKCILLGALQLVQIGDITKTTYLDLDLSEFSHASKQVLELAKTLPMVKSAEFSGVKTRSSKEVNVELTTGQKCTLHVQTNCVIIAPA